jgi:hypothetical protein
MNIDTNLSIMWFFFIATLIIYFSFLEWWVHKYPMHSKNFKNIPILGLLFQSHVGPTGHHSRHGYCPNHPECHDHKHEHEPILQKFWFGFLVAFGGSLPFLVLEFFTSFKYNLTIICFLGIYVYYWFFELVHVATHDGKHWQRVLLEKIGYFDVMLDHHIVHHTIKFNMNFTLVNHWCDYLFDTKYEASKNSVLIVRLITAMFLIGFLISFLNVA